jgi:hypothetical protein
MMLCFTCTHGVIQKVKDKDMVDRELVYCDLIGWHIDRLIECSRYDKMGKAEKEVLERIKSVVTDEGEYQAIIIPTIIKKKGWPKGKKRKSGVSG